MLVEYNEGVLQFNRTAEHKTKENVARLVMEQEVLKICLQYIPGISDLEDRQARNVRYSDIRCWLGE